MIVRDSTLPVQLGDGTFADIAALPMPASDTMRGHDFSHRILWEAASSARNEYGKPDSYAAARAIPCRLEEKDTINRKDGDKRVPVTVAYLCRDVGAKLGDRFRIGTKPVVECMGIKTRDGFQTILLAGSMVSGAR